MKVIITSKGVRNTDHLKETIEKKFSKLGKYFSNEIVVGVTLLHDNHMQKVEATINAKGTIFRAEYAATDLIAAVDAVVDKLSAQMSKFKSKLVKKHKDNKAIIFEDVPDPEEQMEKFTIVKRKKFDLEPMSTEEAILQMELIEHSFFIFLDMDTDNIGVIYKRKDGTYGLLETEV